MSHSSIPSASHESSSRHNELAALFGLIAVVVLGAPQFVRMPLTNDPVYFDLQADLISGEGVLYRDMIEPNFPGVVWIHALIRPIVGSTSEGLRLFDLAVVAVGLGLLAWGIGRIRGAWHVALWTVAAMCWFYFSLAEWSHCQRDAWLLAPALLAVTLRERQLSRIGSGATNGTSILGWGIAEGLVWGGGIWLKPHIIFPCLAVWLIGAVALRRGRASLMDGLGVLTGGLIAGLAGGAWLTQSGTWPYFWESLTTLAPEYAAAGRRAWTYQLFLSMWFRLLPWSLVHLVAFPLAVRWTWRALRRAPEPVGSTPALHPFTTTKTLGIWSALYLAWTIQALTLQILFDYVHVPGVILAAMIVGLSFAGEARVPAARYAAILFGVAALWASPLPNIERLKLWPQCVIGPNSPELRNELRQIREPDWVDLERIAEFLERQEVQDGDVIGFGNHLVHLYPRLGIRPTIRYVYQAYYLTSGLNRRGEVGRDLAEHPPRFIVSDLTLVLGKPDFAERPGAAGPHSLPAGIPEKALRGYPLRYPVVYRAGGLVVHRFVPQAKERQ